MMKKRLLRLRQAATSPQAKEALHSMKPERSIWGFLGVLLFFIAPEIVAFLWGEEITAYANAALETSPAALEYYYDVLLFLFEGGGSWFNLAIGVIFLAWLFY